MLASVKNLLVASPLGNSAATLRNWSDLKRLSFRNPEKAHMVANAIIADRLIAHLPAKGSNFLDIGAHIGSIFSAVHGVNKSAQIYAIEADAGKVGFLEKNFPYCTIKNCAVGPEPGKATFYLSDQSGYNSLVDGQGTQGATVEVEIHTLDALFPDTVFDTIKIDIEGAELGALQGGTALFKRSRPTLMFESTSTEENSLGYSAEKLWKWLDEEGFQVFTPDRLGHDAPPLALETFLDAHHYPRRTHNFFAVASERRVEIRDRARSILGI